MPTRQKSLFFAIVGFVVAVCLPVSSATADQWVITVPDAGFDDHILTSVGDWIDIADTGYTGAWKCHSGDAWIDYGYYAGDGDLPARSGNNKAYGYLDYIYQILDETFIEGGTYTLSVWAGQAWSGYLDGWRLYFTTEDYTNNLIETGGNALVGDWGQVSLEYTATAADAGKKVGIKMWGDEYVTFEDVTLSYDGPSVSSLATNPFPDDGDRYDNDGVLLSWTKAAAADEHDVYFGTDFNDVNDAVASEPPVDPYKGRQAEVSYEVSGLVPGTTYYWRIDEVKADVVMHKGTVWSFWLAPWEPYNPSPPDDAMYMDPNVDLSWSEGFDASQHEVFFGTDPCSLKSIYDELEPNTCDPGPLLKDTTYYWQVKEYQPEDRTTLGPIWSFSTTLPTLGTILYEYWDGITPTGTSLSLLYDWPDFPDNPTGTQILTLFEGPTNRENQFGGRMRAWLYAPVTGDYKFWIATDDNGELWLSTDEKPANARKVSYVSAWAGPRNWSDGDVYPSDPISLEAGKRYYISALYKEGGGDDNIAVGWTTPLDNTIQVIPGRYLEPFVQWWAYDPSPADGAHEALRPITLRWKAGSHANQHKVYFGTSEASMTLQDTLSVGTEEYALPDTLYLGQTYYWKVNEVNMAEEPNTWEGELWSFTVSYISIDDMESYTTWDIPDNNLFDTWSDGYGSVACEGGNGTGSLIDVEQGTIHDGEKSMIFVYDNDGKIYCTSQQAEVDREAYSKVKIDIDDLPSQIGPNWLADGAEVLVLWFQGNVEGLDNIEPMSVELTDGSDGEAFVPYGFYLDEDDVNDIYDGQWHEWNIALQDFNDGDTPVDLTDVNSIAIIIGDKDDEPSGTGTMYFDDIRLYRPKCVLGRRSSDFALLDYAPESTGGDCFVNNIEVEVMAENWLGAVMVPITVPDAGFDDQELVEGGYLYISDTEYTGAWKSDYDGDGAWVDNRYYIDDAAGPDLPPLSGNNKAYGGEEDQEEDDYIYQILDETFIEGETYTLSVWTGLAWSGYADGWWLYFTGEDYTNNLIETSGSAPVGSWQQVSLVYTATAADAGKKIGIKMKGGIYVTFEDVTLFHSSGQLTADPRVNLHEDMIINFRDFAKLGDRFLEEDMFP